MGKMKTRMQARTVPPVIRHGPPRCSGFIRELVVAAVVVTISVAVAGAEFVMLTGVVVPKLNVGGY